MNKSTAKLIAELKASKKPAERRRGLTLENNEKLKKEIKAFSSRHFSTKS